MGMILQETFRLLCDKSGWCYAVFWKLKRRSRMILTWEDGYYEFAKPSAVSNDFSRVNSPFNELKTGGRLLDCRVFGQETCSVEDEIGLAIAKMSYQVYSLGEGVIGHVASNGNHQWIFKDKSFIHKSNSIGTLNCHSMHEYPAVFQNQFAAGIKTIAVVAVVPHGVVQLGSMQMIMEDLELISRIRTVFGTVQNVPGSFLSNRLQQSLSGKIQGSLFPSLTIPQTSDDQSPVQTKTVSSLQGHPNAATYRTQKPNVLGQYEDPCDIRGKDKNIQAKSPTVPSVNICSPSTKISSQESRQNGKEIYGLAHAVSIHPGTEMRGTVISPPASMAMYPLQGLTQVNKLLADSPHALLTGLGIRNNSMGVMEQEIPTRIGLQGPLQPPSTSRSIHSLSMNSLPDILHESCLLNSNISQVELNNGRKQFESDFLVAEQLPGAAMAASGSPHSGISQKKEMLSPASALSQSESLASSRQFSYTNQATRMNMIPKPKDDANLINVSCISPTTSLCIQTCAFDSGQPSWGVTARQLHAEPIKLLNNGLAGGLLMSDPIGKEQQTSWVKQITAKYKSGFYDDIMVEKGDHMEVSLKDIETGIQDLLAIKDGHNGSGGDTLNGCKEYLNSLIRSQDNVPSRISHHSGVNELFQGLGSAFRKETDRFVQDEKLFSRRDEFDVKLFPHSFGTSVSSAYQSNLTQNMHKEEEGCISYGTKSEYLLDAVVGNVHSRVDHSVDDNVSSKTISLGSSTSSILKCPSDKTDSCSAGKVGGSEQSQRKFTGLSRSIIDRGNLQNSIFHSTKESHLTVESLMDENPSITQFSSCFDAGQNSKCENSMIGKERQSASPVKVNRKRASPGESGRPKPKDRQQIQDRVRELREIVPNGTKCSIDSLLERTIKHMIFLQSVTKHTEKLKRIVEKKVLDKDSCVIARNNLDDSSCWALELGDQSIGCPIIVENLNQPRQMLVEMLCEEQGHFLEIADIIRGLGLTILKGIMEAHCEKIWAHFVVEADKDVSRVEILLLLVQLLQPISRPRPMISIQPSLLR